MTRPTYGIEFNEAHTESRPAQGSDLSVLSLTLPADDADADAFPLNQTVVINTSDQVKLGKAGDGELAYNLAAIDDQLADFQTAARVCVTRVEQGETTAETISNIIGNAGARTGLYALLSAGQRLGVIPRIIAAPGYTHQTTMNGQVMQANPVCAVLPGICSKLLATAVVSGPGTDEMDAIQWRETLASDRLIPMDGWVLPGLSNTHTDGVGQALGLFSRVDFQHSGLPFWSISGQQINNIRDVKNHYSFSLTDGATQAQEMLAEQIGTITRGEVGVETAASGSGFQFLGVWNASTDPLKWFYNKRRGRDWTHLALLKSLRLRLGVENVTPGAVDAVLRDMQEIGAYLIQRKCVVGFKCDFVRSDNSPAELRQGRFVVTYAQEEPAPITRIGINSQPYFKALEVELNTLIAQAGTLVPQYLTN